MSMFEANRMTWAFTIAEIVIGAWLVIGHDMPLAGGVLIGLAMGTQLARIAHSIAN